MSNVDDAIAVRTRSGTVEYAVWADGTMPARDFVLGLEEKVRNRLLALFRHVAEQGGKRITSNFFKPERGDLWTFKTKHEKRRIRLPCFQRGNRWIITHGFVKPPKAKWPEQEFTLAFRIQQEVDDREKRKAQNRKGG